jgi:RecA-family ATPase
MNHDENEDVNDTARRAGIDAVRRRHDEARRFGGPAPTNLVEAKNPIVFKPNGGSRAGQSGTVSAPLEIFDAGEDDDNIPPRGKLLGNVFCREFMSSLLADGGTGKTALRVAQLMSLATGRELTGERVYVRSRVLLVSLEDSLTELRRRVKACRLHHSVSKQDLAGWFFMTCPGADAGRLMEIDAKGTLILGALRDMLDNIVTARKIDLICLDPFVKAHAVGENTNDAIDKVVGILTDLSHKHRISVDAPHHVSKGGPKPAMRKKAVGQARSWMVGGWSTRLRR